jgi:hypothetical protein
MIETDERGIARSQSLTCAMAAIMLMASLAIRGVPSAAHAGMVAPVQATPSQRTSGANTDGGYHALHSQQTLRSPAPLHRTSATDETTPTSSLPSKTTVFEAGIGGFPCVRVPSLLAIPGGPLLAFAECRLFTGDGCEPHSHTFIISTIDNNSTSASHVTVDSISSSTGGATSTRSETSSNKISSSSSSSSSSGSSSSNRNLNRGSFAKEESSHQSGTTSDVTADLRDRVVCMRSSTDGGATWGPLVSNISRGRGM